MKIKAFLALTLVSGSLLAMNPYAEEFAPSTGTLAGIYVKRYGSDASYCFDILERPTTPPSPCKPTMWSPAHTEKTILQTLTDLNGNGLKLMIFKGFNETENPMHADDFAEGFEEIFHQQQ